MIDFKRRAFLFGVAATAAIVPVRSIFIMPQQQLVTPNSRVLFLEYCKADVELEIACHRYNGYGNKLYENLIQTHMREIHA